MQTEAIFNHDGIKIDHNQNVYVHTDDSEGDPWYSPPELPPLSIERVQRLLKATDTEKDRFSRRIKAYLVQVA